MADAKSLIKKRASIKAKLTQFLAYLNIAKSCEKLSDVQVIEIEYRLNTFEGLYEKYDALQMDLEALTDDPSEQYSEREDFEKQYYALVATARQLISSARSHDADSEVDLNCTKHIHKQNTIRLPKIDLPKFSGSYQDWLEFRDTFISIIHNNDGIDKINKLHYLRASLKGSASLVVDSLDFRAENYDVAFRLLCDRYDNKRLLVNNHVQALFNLQPIKLESSKSLRHILDTTNKNLRALATLGQPVQYWDTLIIYIVTNKLDQITNREWEEHRNSLPDPPTLNIFVTFLSNRADLLETLEESRSLRPNYNSHTISNKSKSFVAHTEDKLRTISCPLCQQDHFIFSCDKFRSLSVQDRLKKANSYNICINCLKPGHNVSNCKLGHCKYCVKKHNTLLHDNNTDSNTQSIVLSANHAAASRVVLLSTALVRVMDCKGNHQTARVLLDNGSTANFIAESFVRKLQISTYNASSKVIGINESSSISSLGCHVSLKSLNDDYKINIDCFVLPKVSTSVPSTFVDPNKIRIPQNVHLADPEYYIPSSIDILVGAEVFWSIIGTSRITLGKNMPALFESKLGWLVTGVSQQLNTNPQLCMLTDKLHTDLSCFWKLDSVDSEHKFTAEERACEQLFVDTTRRNADGRFVVNIPLKESPNTLSDSFVLAKQRFLSLEKRFSRYFNYKQRYVEFMNEYINLGHMSICSGESSNPLHFLPHHGVSKESSSTTKLRVVFDASAKTTSGRSLNEIQMIGPTLQDDLSSILLRFRQHKIAVSADIEKMYRQTLVTKDQRTLQKILWRASSNLPLQSYTLNTVTYGTASAPFLATRCLVQLSRECLDPTLRFTIEHDFYVDDYLSGDSSISATVKKCRQVVTTLKSARYILRKWQSNSPEVLKALCTESNHSDFVTLSLDEMSKTLGLNWRCSSDSLSFIINLPKTEIDTATKRQILSTIAQIFDPIKLVVPCIVEAKIIMQKFWHSKCSWDDPVPENIQLAWNAFQNTLPMLNTFNIPRWVTFESPKSLQLHIIADASEKAYGACVYVRSVSHDGKVHVILLTAKSRVAPIKPVTIPRLELCAALLSSRLYSKVHQSLTLHVDDVTFWCDSTIVLGWLSMPATQLKVFVRHRVSEIQDTVGKFPWRYVPSQENPADLASRGLSAEKLLTSSLWWTGPEFLHKDSSSWPSFPNLHCQDKSYSQEIITSFHVDTSEPTSNQISLLCNKFSSFNKLQRVTAYVMRFINNCRRKSLEHGSITHLELTNSLHFLLTISQQESFPEEYKLLLLGKQLPLKNKLLTLSPFIDSSLNLIRVGGRLNNSFYDYNVKHPILLSSKHIICKLLFQMFHLRLLHAGPQLLLTTIRHHYYPIGGRNLAKKVVHQCIKCCRIKASTVQPVMGNLPEQRLHLEFPFLNTGVDYAGPILIADRKGRGCKVNNSFICVFVCLATRAVHLELVSDLTKEAFLASLSRFIARRGKPRSIFSDNGTNFVGAFNELSKLLSQDFKFHDVDSGISFSFIPAYTPHFGGLWESAVKSIKHHLRRILGLTHLTFEEMATCLIQVEAILNSRPLTPLSHDPSDLTPLTPAHFLIGRSLVMLPHPQIEHLKITNLQRFRRIEYLKQHFWARFSNDYIIWLQERTKWRNSSGELKEGTLVVIKDKGIPALMWLLGRIVRVFPGRDGIARVADIRTQRGVIRRAFNTICPLPIDTARTIEEPSTGGVC